ncbi:MAG TPA: methyltransferase domain-containing protein [Ktedonosporobacter sp.]|nr:methyltransferase domain-containing protein [Ktedonosporobacter sp.]
MSEQGSSNSDNSAYPLDAENVAEMARLIRQARVLTDLTGLLPADVAITSGYRVLDIGCCPGEWTLAVAEQYSGVDITGIDISEMMTQYASFLARERELHHFTHFLVMDARGPLAFPENSFDLIHARTITGFLSKEDWPKLLAECFRILKPGGRLIGVESDDLGVTTSPSMTCLLSLGMIALHRVGHYFTAEGEHSGLAAVHPQLLRNAGFADVKREAFALDFSAGSAAHKDMAQNWATIFELGAPFLIRLGLGNEGELAVLRARAIHEARSADFCAVLFLQRVWGQKVG